MNDVTRTNPHNPAPLLVRAHGRTYVDRATVTYALEGMLNTDFAPQLHELISDLIGEIDTEKGYE